MSALGIGSSVWYRCEERRVYEGRGHGPTERGHWLEGKIVGESARMWLLDCRRKLPKNGRVPAGFATSALAVEQAIWSKENVYAIAKQVEHLHWGVVPDSEAAFGKLKAVAEILGYPMKAPS